MEKTFNWRKEMHRINNRMRPSVSTPMPETVAEYIKRTGAKTESRVSKRGVELIKVYYPDGIREYELANIDRTNAPVL